MTQVTNWFEDFASRFAVAMYCASFEFLLKKIRLASDRFLHMLWYWQFECQQNWISQFVSPLLCFFIIYAVKSKLMRFLQRNFSNEIEINVKSVKSNISRKQINEFRTNDRFHNCNVCQIIETYNSEHVLGDSRAHTIALNGQLKIEILKN